MWWAIQKFEYMIFKYLGTFFVEHSLSSLLE